MIAHALAEPSLGEASLAEVAEHPGMALGVSAIVLLLDDHEDVAARYRAYKAALEPKCDGLRFVYVVAAANRLALQVLHDLRETGEPLTTLVLNRWDDDAAALRSGLPHTTGQLVVTLPASPQVDDSDLGKLIDAAAQSDLVFARRGGGEALATSRLIWVTRQLFKHGFSDLTCDVRVYRRHVLDEIATYSAPLNLLPLVASHRGFKVSEVPVIGQWPRRSSSMLGSFFRRMRMTFDIISLYFALNFTRKPLRFFGAIGLPISAAGGVLLSVLAFQRLVFGSALADRPLVILGVMLVVLGVQILSLGLIAEIIVFVSGKRVRDYTIECILRAPERGRGQR